MPQGHCTLPADDAGRVLDRLAGLEKMIRPEDIQQALAATGRVNSRSCPLTHEVVLWVVLAMGLLTDLPIRQVFKAARRLRKGEESPHRSSLCVARQRLGVAPVRHLFDQVVRPLARPETPGAFYQRLAVDGHRRHGLRCPRLGGQRGRLRPPLGRAARRRCLPSGPQAQLGRIGDPCRSRHGRAGPPPMASNRWSPVCSAI